MNSLTQLQKDFLTAALQASSTSGELLNLILGANQGGTGPGLPDTVDPPGPRGYVTESIDFLLTLPDPTGANRNIVLGLM